MHLIMCRHEICLLHKYIPHYFDIQYHHRDSVTKSFNCGEQKVQSIQESEKDCLLDKIDTEDDGTVESLTIQEVDDVGIERNIYK